MTDVPECIGKIDASLSLQGSLVSEIFKTQADGVFHGSAFLDMAAQVSWLL
jgi:hypothetical protein